MKIAVISPLPPEKPGEAIYTARLIAALAKNRKLEIIAIGGPSSKPLDIQIGHVETASIWKGRSLLYPLTVWRYIKKRGIHLVHVQFGPHGEVYGGMFGEVMLFLLLLLKYTGVKTTITLHSTWMISFVKKRIQETPKISLFSILSPAIFKLYIKLLNWGTNTIQLSTVKIGSTLKQRFLREYEFAEEKVLEIPHPCMKVMKRISKEDAKKQLGVTDKEIILVFGFIRRDKGIHLAMDAIKKVCKTEPNILLLVAGEPFDEDGEEYLQELLQLQKEYDLFVNVRFDTDFIPEEDISVYFTAASIILAPYTESIGASGPLHASAGYGIPIVASDAGLHISEALGGNVLTFNQLDPESLSKQINYLLVNRNIAQQISTNLIEYSESESYDVAAKRTRDYYKITMGFESSSHKE
ncbi:MAG: glycosyltransferase [Candidatus Thorarchaeota archaeon]|nr:MAG: glycosyltransferase [Candidatus Thorarchaeota archaeon]